MGVGRYFFGETNALPGLQHGRQILAGQTERLTPVAKRNEKTGAEPLSPQKPDTRQTPKMEIDFESLIAVGIAAAIIKPSEKGRQPKPKPKW
jgi:hypothetical protein